MFCVLDTRCADNAECVALVYVCLQVVRLPDKSMQFLLRRAFTLKVLHSAISWLDCHYVFYHLQ